MNTRDAIYGCLLGTAIGDALGLPCEALPLHKQRKFFGEISGHRLFFGRGMYSDDAEHTILAAQALIASNGDAKLFLHAFARQLRTWIVMLPGGVGLATLKAGWKLVFGASPERSGVFSAGNGPAMRAAILGVFCATRGDISPLIALNRASSRITHSDPKAEYGARAVALAAYFAASENEVVPREYFVFLRNWLPESDNAASELLLLIEKAVASVENGFSTPEFVQNMGWKSASGYMYHTVPAALHAWLCHPENYRDGVLEIIACGGDTDSTAAIVGGLIGARVGASGIPQEWRSGLMEWPRGVAWLEKIAERLAQVGESGAAQKPLPTLWPGVLARNVFFLLVVLTHGFRRILPL